MTTQTLRRIPRLTLLALLLASLGAAQTKKAGSPPATDLSGMYTFLQEGEFVQISVEAGEREFVKTESPGMTPAGASKASPATDGKQHSTQERYDPPALEKTGGAFPKPRRVTGFLSRFGDLASDKGAFLDHFFTKGALYGDEITFTTKTVHGVWFEFKGKVERGAANSRAEEGYYTIRGTLKRFAVDGNKQTTSQARELVLKSFPDLDAETTKP